MAREDNYFLQKGFLAFFITQFLGAFNDNAFKLAMLTLISYKLSHSQEQSEFLQAIAGMVFVLPFLLLSTLAGQVIDKFDKSIICRWVKAWEFLLMILGSFGLYYGMQHLLLFVLAGLGVHSAFFGPIKYSIIQPLVQKKELLPATALVQGSTFLAILTGTMLGTLSVAANNPIPAIVLTIFVSGLGFISSLFIPPISPTAPKLDIQWNFIATGVRIVGAVLRHKPILPVILAISWFWFMGSVIMIKLPDYVHFVLGAVPDVLSLFLGIFSICIALGSLLSKIIQKGDVDLRYLPVCMILMTLFLIDIYFSSYTTFSEKTPLKDLGAFLHAWSNWRCLLDFSAFSILGGMYIVPAYASLQLLAKKNEKGRTVAVNNVINTAFMLAGSLFVIITLSVGCSIVQTFLILALLNVLLLAVIVFLLHSTPSK